MNTPQKKHNHVGVPTNVIEKRQEKINKKPIRNIKGECGACVHKRQLSKCNRPQKGVQKEGKYRGDWNIWPADADLPGPSYFFCKERWTTKSHQGCMNYVPKKVGLRKEDTLAEVEQIRQRAIVEKEKISSTLRANPYARYET